MRLKRFLISSSFASRTGAGCEAEPNCTKGAWAPSNDGVEALDPERLLGHRRILNSDMVGQAFAIEEAQGCDEVQAAGTI